MTIGEYRVGIDFNPSGSLRVNTLKKLAADFIDECNKMADQTSDPEVGRCITQAATHAEDAAMWAVKAATKKPIA